MPESTYRSLISEARRVLKPGGFLELAILDLDMLNMGPKARRNVRGLKEGLRRKAGGDLVLGSASDVIMRCVNKRGFVNIRSCRVGVPVASIIDAKTPAGSSPGKPTPTQTHTTDEPSFSQMLSDPTHKGDVNISKMVAKVGRWWYQRCYESALFSMPDSPTLEAMAAPCSQRPSATAAPSHSIFDDPAVLRECESWSSSFKLVVAYAQKPLETVTRRRTTSV